MKYSTFYALVLTMFLSLLLIQCDQGDLSTIGNQEEVLNDLLEHYLLNNPLFDLYDANELTIEESEEIIQELNKGYELDIILSKYITNKDDVKRVAEFCYQFESLARKLKQFDYSKTEIQNKVEKYTILLEHEKTAKPKIGVRRWENQDPCIEQCTEEYNMCMQFTKEDAATNAVIVIGLGVIGAPWTGGAASLAATFIGAPFAGGVTYLKGRRQCIYIYKSCQEDCDPFREER